MPATQELINFIPGPSIQAAPRPTRVLLVAPYEPIGGGMGRMMDYLARTGAAMVRFEKIESRGGRSAIRSMGFMLYAAWCITRAACSADPVIVHLNMAEGTSVLRKGSLLLLSRALGLPAVLHLHAADIIGFHEQLPAPARVLMALVFRCATVCVVLGQPWRIFLHQHLRVPQARIEILYNGVPYPVVCRFPAPKRIFTFVFIGNLLARKGWADLVRAIADPRLMAEDIRLVVAGGGNDVGLRRLAATLGVEGRISCTGWLGRDETTLMLAHAGALVLPSYHEGLPLVLAEAAALGLPIIATPVGAIPEVFENGVTALLVPPGNRRALADAMLCVATSPELAARLGRNASALYARALTMDRFVSGLLSIYGRHCGAQMAPTA